jgi:uncharacterized repeat protein (TIGR01451 family)
MKTRTAKLLVSLMLAASLISLAYSMVKVNGANQPVIWTDKPDYYPEETVTIFGSNFLANAQITASVTRPDSTVNNWAVTSDSDGNFTTTYQLDGIQGTYTVVATDGTNTANTTFTDAQPAANLDQVRNGAFDSPISPADWVNGNVGSQTGHYVEGYSIPYRCTMTDMPIGATVMLTIEYDIKHSSKNAIDYLTNYSRINDPSHQLVFGHSPEVIDPLIGVTGVTGPNSSFIIPAPSSAGSPVPGQPTTSYNNLVGNETSNGVRMLLFGGTITNIAYNVQGDLTVADSSTSINVTLVTGSATEVLAWGGHIASRADWGFTNGVPNSAGGISGSPYHMRLLEWHLIPVPAKSKDDLPNLGNQDRSLSAVAVFAPSAHPNITLTKTPDSTKVENGSSVTYTYNVTNTGDVTLNVTLVDDQFGTIFTNLTMASGESNITTITRVLFASTTNIANATGVYPLTSASVNATASASVTVLHPKISLTKVADASKVENGTSVTYTYNVTNTGDTALTVSLVDDTFGTIFTGKVLAPGAFNVTVISEMLMTTTTNTATATGVDQLSTSVQAQATKTVTVLHPKISLTKVADASKVENGTSVTYTYNVTNTGDTALTVSLVDDTFGTIFTGKVLAPGAFNVTVISEMLMTTTTNTATATGVDQLSTSVQAQATKTVTVLHPKISLTKTPSSTKVLNGSSVTYTYNVTNTGDTTLMGINVTDDLLGFIGSAVLLPGASATFTNTTILTTNTTNTATAVGVDQLGTRVQATTSGFVVVIHPAISVTKTCSPENQLAPGTITWTVIVTNTGDVTLTGVNITDTRHGELDAGITLAPGKNNTYVIVESGLPPGTYYDNATAIGAFQLGTVSAWDDATCVVKPTFILKQFTSVTVLPDGLSQGFNATLVSPTQVNVTGLKSGPYIYFNITYYFENSLNFLGSSFDGQAHNFTLWDKWGGNLMALGSQPIAFNPAKGVNNLTLADGNYFRIDPGLTGPHTYRGYIGSGLDISNLASQGTAFITMHLGDQQNGTNPGGGKGTSNDGKSYDTDTIWYIGELGVNQSATLTLIIAPGKNPGGQLEFTSQGCTVINTGPRVRAYGNTYNNIDFLYAVERTNTLTVCVKPKP